MPLLKTHLEQISLSAAAISDLPFPPPKIFTNAILHPHDITALIRDTDAHERALFSLAGASIAPSDNGSKTARRKTMSNVNRLSRANSSRSREIRAGRTQSAVAAVLGGDMTDQMKTADGGNIDVQVLLRGAEKLCAVYPLRDAAQKISALRSRYSRVKSSIAHYEAIVAEQSVKLDRLNQGNNHFVEELELNAISRHQPSGSVQERRNEVIDEDLRREEEEIRELEAKKFTLEKRVSGIERDLGGLLR